MFYRIDARTVGYRAGLIYGRSEVQISDRPNLTQHCKWFATASTSTQVAVWRYDAEMGSGHHNSLHDSALIWQV